MLEVSNLSKKPEKTKSRRYIRTDGKEEKVRITLLLKLIRQIPDQGH